MGDAHHDAAREPRPDDDRYPAVEMGEETIIYEADNHAAWISSDAVVDVAEMQ